MVLNKKNIILVLTFFVNTVLGANILYVSPIASPSHHIWNKALALGLIKKGHNVTMLTHETEKGPVSENFTLITMEGIYDILYESFSMEDLAEQSTFGSVVSMYDYGLFCCEYDYNTTGLQTLLNYPANYKFDLIIFDATIGRCYYPLIERFHNPPTLAVTPFLLPPVLSAVFGNHQHTSYVPFYGTQFTNKMSLSERIINFIYTYSEILYRNYVFLPKEDQLIKEQFKELTFSIDKLERGIHLLLSNTDPILEYPEALPPNIIPVGGLHAQPARALPKDLQKIMDDAKQGVILFSLGTNVRSDKLGLTTRQALLQAFAKLPQIVLWKFESENIEGLPKNVIIRKWLPQNDILGHPHTKLFINHGGALSSQEAIYHGIPVIGIPFFADQHVNIRKMEAKGIAIHLDKDHLTTDVVYNAVNTVLNSAVNKMKTLSKMYHDQAQTALEKGVFWTEYMLRHGSAEHLVSPARDMSGFQTANFDVLIVFLIGIALTYSFLLLLFTCCKFVISAPSYNKKPKTSK